MNSELNWAHMQCAIDSLRITGIELDRVAVVFTTLQSLAVQSRNPSEYEALDWLALAEITCRGPLANIDVILRSYRSTLIWVSGANARLEVCRRTLSAASYSLWFAADVDANELENPIAKSLREMKGLLEQLAVYADAMGKTLIAAHARKSWGAEQKEQTSDMISSLDEVIEDPATSFWLKGALTALMERDPVDAVKDAELLARILDRQCRNALRNSAEKRKL